MPTSQLTDQEAQSGMTEPKPHMLAGDVDMPLMTDVGAQELPLHHPRNQQHQTNLRAFMRGSKVVDELGNPEVVYHASISPFDVFDPKYNYDIYSHYYDEWNDIDDIDDIDEAPNDVDERVPYVHVPESMHNLTMDDIPFDERDNIVDYDLLSALGVHFGTQQAANSRYNFLKDREKNIPWEYWDSLKEDAEAMGIPEILEEIPERPQYSIWPVYLNLQHPLGSKEHPITEGDLRKLIQYKGLHYLWDKYDGVIYTNDVEDAGNTSYIAFSPYQIKSATGNSGTYNPDAVEHHAQVAKSITGTNPKTKRRKPIWNTILNSMLAHPQGIGTPEESRYDKVIGNQTYPTKDITPEQKTNLLSKYDEYAEQRNWEDYQQSNNIYNITDEQQRAKNLATFMQGSVVVNPDGSPMVVYHGTHSDEEYSVMNPMQHIRDRRNSSAGSADPISAIGLHFGTYEAANARLGYSSDKPTIQGMAGSRVIPCYLSIKRPLGSMQQPISEEALDNLLSRKGHAWLWENYDGVIYRNDYEDTNSISFIAFSPYQVKSAVGNTGHYNPESIIHRASVTTQTLYHGGIPLSKARGTVWFSTSKDVAGVNAGDPAKWHYIRALGGNPEESFPIETAHISLANPYVVDAKDASYLSIKTPKEILKSGYTSELAIDTDSIAEWAERRGYDGAIIKNVLEGKGACTVADTVAVFNWGAGTSQSTSELTKAAGKGINTQALAALLVQRFALAIDESLHKIDCNKSIYDCMHDIEELLRRGAIVMEQQLSDMYLGIYIHVWFSYLGSWVHGEAGVYPAPSTGEMPKALTLSLSQYDATDAIYKSILYKDDNIYKQYLRDLQATVSHELAHIMHYLQVYHHVDEGEYVNAYAGVFEDDKAYHNRGTEIQSFVEDVISHIKPKLTTDILQNSRRLWNLLYNDNTVDIYLRKVPEAARKKFLTTLYNRIYEEINGTLNMPISSEMPLKQAGKGINTQGLAKQCADIILQYAQQNSSPLQVKQRIQDTLQNLLQDAIGNQNIQVSLADSTIMQELGKVTVIPPDTLKLGLNEYYVGRLFDSEAWPGEREEIHDRLESVLAHEIVHLVQLSHIAASEDDWAGVIKHHMDSRKLRPGIPSIHNVMEQQAYVESVLNELRPQVKHDPSILSSYESLRKAIERIPAYQLQVNYASPESKQRFFSTLYNRLYEEIYGEQNLPLKQAGKGINTQALAKRCMDTVLAYYTPGSKLVKWYNDPRYLAQVDVQGIINRELSMYYTDKYIPIIVEFRSELANKAAGGVSYRGTENGKMLILFVTSLLSDALLDTETEPSMYSRVVEEFERVFAHELTHVLQYVHRVKDGVYTSVWEGYDESRLSDAYLDRPFENQAYVESAISKLKDEVVKHPYMLSSYKNFIANVWAIPDVLQHAGKDVSPKARQRFLLTLYNRLYEELYGERNMPLKQASQLELPMDIPEATTIMAEEPKYPCIFKGDARGTAEDKLRRWMYRFVTAKDPTGWQGLINYLKLMANADCIDLENPDGTKQRLLFTEEPSWIIGQ